MNCKVELKVVPLVTNMCVVGDICLFQYITVSDAF